MFGPLSAASGQGQVTPGESTSAIQHEGSSAHPTRQTGPHAHSIAVDPDNRFVLVTDLGTTTYLSVLDEKNARPLMRSAIDTLIRFQVTSREGALPAFDEAFLRREMELM